MRNKLAIMMATATMSMVSASSVFAQGEAVNAEDIISDKAQVQFLDSNAQIKTQDALALGLDAAKKENEDENLLKEKQSLAKQMHQIRPTRLQIDGAVKRASLMLPANEREPFVNVMNSMLNYNAIERISIDAMVQTYTLAELKVMVEYFSKPEALTAAAKMGHWAGQVQPEITRMIDKAILRIKTGQ